MISINLLPDIKKNLLRVRRERNLVVTVSIVAVTASVGVLFLLGAMLAGATIIKNGHIGKIDDYESEIEEAKDKDQLNEYLTVQNQLSQIDGLKGEQKVYSRLMDYLVQLNPAAPNNAALKSVSLEDAMMALLLLLKALLPITQLLTFTRIHLLMQSSNMKKRLTMSRQMSKAMTRVMR